jgi:putative Mn2+ efflux pump MntP
VVFGTFEFLMPLLGVWLGKTVSENVGTVAQYVAPAILAVLGILAIVSAFRHTPHTERWAKKLSSWRGLLLLELGLSLDNLVAGFSLGIGDSHSSPLLIAGIIALFSITYTWAGMKIGARGYRIWEKRAKFVTGILLLVLALISLLGWLEPV